MKHTVRFEIGFTPEHSLILPFRLHLPSKWLAALASLQRLDDLVQKRTSSSQLHQSSTLRIQQIKEVKMTQYLNCLRLSTISPRSSICGLHTTSRDVRQSTGLSLKISSSHFTDRRPSAIGSLHSPLASQTHDLQMQVANNNEAGSSNFQYLPLLQRNGQTTDGPNIRLIELQPGHASQQIQCYMREAPLSNGGVYEAVSYCWGGPEDQTGIICNGKLLYIPRNLEEALHGLRYKDRCRLLWADAICINQSDTAEKGSQVQLMRTIYAGAKRTIIWLGRARDRHDQGISVFAKFSVKIGLVGLRSRLDPSSYRKIAVLDTRTLTSRILLLFSSEFYLALICMLRRPWFQRAWVVQEVAVSRKATILWDSVEYDWDDLVQALKYMSTVHFPLAFIVSLRHIAAIENERIRYRNGSNNLLGVLLRHQRCLATDPRDKVFSFCGLINASSAERSVQVSYTNNTSSVYRELAVKVLQHEQTLDILSRPPLPVVSKLAALPSWVPDWSIQTSLEMGHTWGYGPLSLAGAESRVGANQVSRFEAAGKTKYLPEYSLPFGTLTVEGYIFDKVTEVGPIFEGVHLPTAITTLKGITRSWMDTIKSFHQARKVIIRWQQMTKARANPRYITGEPMSEVFWQIVCAGEYHDSSVVNAAARLWESVTRFSASRLDSLGFPYFIFLLVRHLVAKKPLLEFELQGRYTLHRRMAKTSQGYIGLGPGATEVGDSVAICKGSSVPLVLRTTKEPGDWRVVGDAYVHGAMNGELFEESRCRRMSIA